MRRHELFVGAVKLSAEDAVFSSKQVTQEVFLSLAGRTEYIGAPNEQVARPVFLGIQIQTAKGYFLIL